MDLKVVYMASENWANGPVIQNILGGDEGVSTQGPGTGAGPRGTGTADNILPFPSWQSLTNGGQF